MLTGWSTRWRSFGCITLGAAEEGSRATRTSGGVWNGSSSSPRLCMPPTRNSRRSKLGSSGEAELDRLLGDVAAGRSTDEESSGS
jgi:hypothetical protein